MTIVESKLKEGILVFGPKDTPTLTASCQATAVTLEPSQEDSGEAVEVLCGDSLAASTKTSWVLKFTGIQDWESKEGFINFAFDNDGTQVAFSWQPVKDGPTYSGTCGVAAVVIGGDVNTRITSDAEWPVVGKPVRTEAPKPANGAEQATAEGLSAQPAPGPKSRKDG
ncbi:hypothetical protein [Streptomyces sp. NPDC050485]|uniref:hypothetical protein n=1 Tax=Streptomyces sp. NPDC050485 TaxID=3365617 RepID=UPI003790555B